MVHGSDQEDIRNGGKGVVVKETEDAALQSFHAYFGAYGYGHDANTDYVACYVISREGLVTRSEVWDSIQAAQGE